ncbi:flagellar motor switch protein FliG [Lysinimonas soli]|uniref:Flagellar motor switch protein FliG n=1 Tax=Lysinimonas soli TaxID=1074233 RepID=A0ABW0NQP0_9MICO
MSEPAPTGLTGIQKAALVIMQLSQDHAAEVMRQFSEPEAEEIIGEIVRLRRVDAALVDVTIAEFYERTQKSVTQSRGGLEFAEELLQASFGAERAAGFLDRVSSTMAGTSFEFLDAADPHQISSLLAGELAETRALVLAHLAPGKASQVLAKFEASAQLDVAQAIASMRAATPEAVSIVADNLRRSARSVVTPRERAEVVGGVQPLVDIINRADVATEHELLEALDARDPKLAEEVRSRMITFADIVRLEGKDVQQVLRGLDVLTLATALKGAAPELMAIVRDNISERNRESLDDELTSLGRVRKKQIDEARAEISRAIRELEAQGIISLQRSDEVEDEYVS